MYRDLDIKAAPPGKVHFVLGQLLHSHRNNFALGLRHYIHIMAKDMKTIQQTYHFDVAPEIIYQAYLNEKTHTDFTGSPAEIFPQVGGAISAWDGYATGRFIALEPNRLIKQTWHADTWPDGLESMATITLHAEGSGTKLELVHENVPDDEAESIEQGWLDYYWEPLERYLQQSEEI